MSLKLNERYPGRFDNPSADYPQGSFKNRTTPDAKDGSYLEKDWANDKEGFFQSLLEAAGVEASGDVDKVGASQFFDAMLQLKQAQAGVAFTTGGTATALTLTPSPPIEEYVPNQRFSVKFSTVSGVNPTINVSAKGAKSLKQYNGSGAKIAAAFVADQVSDVWYDGTDMVVLDPLPATASLPFNYFAGFSLANNSGAPNTTADVGVGSARDSTNTVDINLSSTVSGILQTSGSWAAGTGQNKLDTGAKANNSTYFVFAIRKTSDGTGDILFSLSPTSPTMPSGYSGFIRLKGRLVTGIVGNIGSFKNRGNGRFDWTTPVVEVRAGPVAIGTTPITLAGLGVLPVIAEVQLMMRADGGAGRLLPTDVTDAATGVVETDWTGGVIANAGGGSADESSSSAFRVATNTSGQINLHTNSGANVRYAIVTTGWQEI